jgi:hypothetical protein
MSMDRGIKYVPGEIPNGYVRVSIGTTLTKEHLIN